MPAPRLPIALPGRFSLNISGSNFGGLTQIRLASFRLIPNPPRVPTLIVGRAPRYALRRRGFWNTRLRVPHPHSCSFCRPCGQRRGREVGVVGSVVVVLVVAAPVQSLRDYDPLFERGVRGRGGGADAEPHSHGGRSLRRHPCRPPGLWARGPAVLVAGGGWWSVGRSLHLV